jgi:LAO/AO transport system kinase
MRIDEQTEKLINGDFYAAAKLITSLENNNHPDEIIKEIYPYRKDSYLLGITGAPGVGKSTITDKLINILREKGKKVGVLAVDPTSPFSGGAILGDRIRLQGHATDKGTFIRSMSTRGHLGGLAPATNNAITVLSVLGCDYIIVETVGVGQSEVEIVKYADIVLLVLTPSSGDSIQIMKAGIMEIGDVFVVNKCDRQGYGKILAELKMLQQLSEKKVNHSPAIIQTIAKENKGIDTLYNAIEDHKKFLADNGKLIHKQKMRIENEIISIIHEKLLSQTKGKLHSDNELLKIVDLVYNKETDPYSIANEIVSRNFRG